MNRDDLNIMKNTIVTWHAQRSENSCRQRSKAISDCYELWESCHFDEVIEKIDNGRVPILLIAADHLGPAIMTKLNQLGEHHPQLQIVALFNKQCSTKTLERLCHTLCTSSEEQLLATEALVSALTRRQIQVLDLISQGYSNKQIADKLHMSEGTVKIHCMGIYKGLGVNNRTQAAMLTNGAL